MPCSNCLETACNGCANFLPGQFGAPSLPEEMLGHPPSIIDYSILDGAGLDFSDDLAAGQNQQMMLPPAQPSHPPTVTPTQLHRPNFEVPGQSFTLNATQPSAPQARSGGVSQTLNFHGGTQAIQLFPSGPSPDNLLGTGPQALHFNSFGALTPPQPTPPPKKRGRPAGSLDKVKRNPKGAGLAKEASYKTSGRPSKEQRDARIAHMRLKQEIKQMKDTEGLVPSHKYVELAELAEKAGLKEQK
ncbi:uncharacterized protein N0V89_010700 [Didymosphaeria variabile]|uniref:Uncharacterized protein n=1 Tax=Didymosphaeria variabile TaxID=1932322 RepID=A0A9W8XCA2_9PLEO|nr:uncharacterized protein N0V89_010700 [Didymosphaeria variabile]KAJ4346768.1 hypothetical protein N0V89_010700 [Didymosphaeria variabile]